MIVLVIWAVIGLLNWVEYLVQKPHERELGGCDWASYWICWICLMLHLVNHAFTK